MKMQAGLKKNNFGMIEIIKTEWEQQVIRAPQDMFVVIHLYQDHVVECQLLNKFFGMIA